jgi:hypothetical protein
MLNAPAEKLPRNGTPENPHSLLRDKDDLRNELY